MKRKFLVGMALAMVAQSTAVAQQPKGTRNGAVIGGVSGAGYRWDHRKQKTRFPKVP